MDADLLTEPDDKIELKGSGIIAAIKASGIEFVLSVPDIVTSGGLLRPIARDPELKLIRVCKEDEGIGIASGLSYCDKRALTPDPAHRLARFHQRHPRRRGRVRASRSA